MMPNGLQQGPLMTRLSEKFGRRGLVLASIGVVYLSYGPAILLLPLGERFSRKGPSPLDWADSPIWGWVWILCGVVAVTFGFRKRFSRDVIGYTAAFIPPAIWTFLHVYSFMVYCATGGEYGEPNTWIAALVWADFVFLIRVCAGWDDPTDPLMIPGAKGK